MIIVSHGSHCRYATRESLRGQSPNQHDQRRPFSDSARTIGYKGAILQQSKVPRW